MIRRIAPLLFLSCLLCLLFPSKNYAQKSAITIAGNIYFENEYTAAKNVSISLMNEERQLLETQSTTDAGQFRFGGLARAMYLLSITAPGYEAMTVEVDVSMGSDKILTLCLKPLVKKQDSAVGKTVSTHELSMPDKAKVHMQAGMKKLYQDRDAKASIGEFEQALQIAPGYYEAAFQLGVAQVTIGNSAAAEASFRNAVAASGNKYPEADSALGAVLLDSGRTLEAERLIRHGLELNPNMWLGHYELGRALLKEDRLFEAQTSAEQAKVLAPGVPLVYRLLSNIHLQQKDYPALLQDLNAYLALDPDSPAGQRAKQVRDQVQAQLSEEHMSPTSAKP